MLSRKHLALIWIGPVVVCLSICAPRPVAMSAFALSCENCLSKLAPRLSITGPCCAPCHEHDLDRIFVVLGN